MWLIGLANRKHTINRFVVTVSLALRFKANESNFSLFLTVWLYLQTAQMPRCRDLAIFVPTDDRRQQTKPIALSLAHVRRVIMGTSVGNHRGH